MKLVPFQHGLIKVGGCGISQVGEGAQTLLGSAERLAAGSSSLFLGAGLLAMPGNQARAQQPGSSLLIKPHIVRQAVKPLASQYLLRPAFGSSALTVVAQHSSYSSRSSHTLTPLILTQAAFLLRNVRIMFIGRGDSKLSRVALKVGIDKGKENAGRFGRQRRFLLLSNNH